MMRRATCGLIVGTVAGLIVTMAVLRWQLADPTPALSADSFQAARRLWAQRGPADYDLEVEVQGPQPGKYRVVVRGGQPTAAFRNEQPLKQQRTFGTWSVPGMFGTMARDLEQVERRRTGNVAARVPDLTLRAQFDSELGYPVRYLRIESGSTADVTWKVTRFQAPSEAK
jgi:hypothetical protein